MKKQAVNVCAITSLLLIAGCGEPPKPVKVEAENTETAYVEEVTPKVEQKVPVVDESAKRAAYQAGYKSGHIVGVADRQKRAPRKGVIAFKMGQIHGKADYPAYASDYANGYHLGYNEGWHGE